ncbi:MAG: ParA family protein [Melioribacteraceae bacterium]|nr:ParA family protein [Melioribacteraceae bacterium]
MGKIIALANSKGGVAKTTSAVNLSIALANKEKKTLLIDADPANQCSIAFGIPDDPEIGSLFNVLSYMQTCHEAINNTENPYFDILPFKNVTFEEELLLNEFKDDTSLFKHQIKPYISEYDYVLIDCPPTLLGMTANVLNIANSVLIPVKSSMFSIAHLPKLLERIDVISKGINPEISVEGIFLTMHEINTRASFAAKKELYRLYPNYMLTTTIPKNVAAEEASFNKDPVIIVDPNAKSSIAYKTLAEEIIEKNQTVGSEIFQSFSDTEHLGDI